MGRLKKVISVSPESGPRSLPPEVEGMIRFSAESLKADSLDYPLRIRERGQVYIVRGFLKQFGYENAKYCLLFASEDGKAVTLYLSADKRLDDDNFQLKDSMAKRFFFTCGLIGEKLKVRGWWYYKKAEVDVEARYEGLPCCRIAFVFSHNAEKNKYDHHRKKKSGGG
jgi:hypothetical protein